MSRTRDARISTGRVQVVLITRAMLIFSLTTALLAAPDVEVARIQTHLAGAEVMLRAGDVSDLSPAQREARARAIERLREYREAGVFPENRDFPNQRRPYFIDAAGTRCAMAHLIEASGDRALVETVARERNNAYVKELAGDPALIRWLDENGMTAAEAARVQPEYGCYPAAQCVCGGFGGTTTGVIELDTAGAASGSSKVISIHGQTGTRFAGAPLSAGAEVPFRRKEGRSLAFVSQTGNVDANVVAVAEIDTLDQMTCSGGTNTSVKISREDAIDAATAGTGCVAALGRIDARLSNTDHCGNETGCRVVTGDLQLGGVILLLALAIMRRRKLALGHRTELS